MNTPDLSSSLDALHPDQLALLTEWVDVGIQSHTDLSPEQKAQWTAFPIESEADLALLDFHLHSAHQMQGMLKSLPTPSVPAGMIARVMKRLRRRHRRQIEQSHDKLWTIEVGSVVILLILVACAWLIIKETHSYKNRFNTPLTDLSPSTPSP